MPDAPSVLALALQHHRTGRVREAAALYEQILAAQPQHADALYLLGLICQQEGNFVRAEQLLDRAVAAQPSIAPYRISHGLALRALGRTAEALDAFAQARAIAPTLAEAHHQEGNALKALGRFAEAAAALREAARLAPREAAIWLNLGVAALETGATAEAITAFRQAIALEPARPEAHNILGHALFVSGRCDEARAAFEAALRIRPDFAPALDNLGRLCKATGQLAEAVAHFRAALAAKPAPGTHSNLLLALNYLPDAKPAEVFAEHRRWNALYAAPLAPKQSPARKLAPVQRPLRVGYVSPDFTHHAVAYFIEPILAAHDRTRVEVFCYANVRVPDATTARLRTLADHWRDIAQLDDDAAAACIRQDEIDLLVDLAGHTAHHRLQVFARRPAPVQATWIGYPNTTGLDAIDYRLTDEICDPPGQTETWHSEKLVRLPSTFSCYQPDAAAPELNALPAVASGRITFGCFNNFAKITPEVIALWGQLIRQLPDAQLLLKSRGLEDPATAARIRAAFADAGVDGARLALNGKELSVHDHLQLYHGVDIGLDPFPYNGTTTTCEALWMGVPVITLAGNVHAARVGASLMSHVGLPDLIATTPDDYVAKAAALARDLPRLGTIRQTLRETMRRSPLCDAAKFTRELEAAYAVMCGPRETA